MCSGRKFKIQLLLSDLLTSMNLHKHTFICSYFFLYRSVLWLIYYLALNYIAGGNNIEIKNRNGCWNVGVRESVLG